MMLPYPEELEIHTSKCGELMELPLSVGMSEKLFIVPAVFEISV